MKIIFAGTPDFAASHLAALLTQGQHSVVAVYTQPDRPAGRGKKLKPGPVKQLAEQHGLPVIQPLSLKNPEDQQQLKAFDADLMVVVAYGLILPQVVLDMPRLGCINVHASLLPRWRGAAPIHRALEAGDARTGVTIMQMEAGLDTGPMLLKAECAIDRDDSGGSLHDKLANIGCEALLKALDALADNSLSGAVQDDALSNYAPKISKEEARLDWSRSATALDLKIRAFNPFPVAFTTLGDARLRVWAAELEISHAHQAAAGTLLKCDSRGIWVACGEGALVLTEIQLPGKKRLPVQAVLNSQAQLFAAGVQLGLSGSASGAS
ncbi:methionyl-tRNA formyltransferase [Gammaproteobacteria bacterium 53_120_T64]|nr:methionyl-tRNA formyltransferase [Gammaproteobacteria bacterium 53_120_T64]